MSAITTADLPSDLVEAAQSDLKKEGAMRSEEEKQTQYQKTLISGEDENLTVNQRERLRIGLN